MPRSIRIGKSAAFVALAVLLTTSCRYVPEERLPETGVTLEGTVTYGGEPVQFAMILVKTADAVATGRVGDDGRYRVENAPAGDVLIGVNTAAATSEYTSKMMGAGAYKGPEATGKGKVTGLKFVQVPPKYADPETSGIKTTVQKGNNTFDIVIPK